MKNIFLFLIIATPSFSQQPLVKMWDHDFGGTGGDGAFSFQQTADSGFILGGCSWSGIGGNKTQALIGGLGDLDYWIIKIDSIGNKQWDKTFGGSQGDMLTSLQQTSDGGFILGGFSGSDSSGNKETNHRGFLSICDYWIIKTDSAGNKQWEKDYG